LEVQQEFKFAELEDSIGDIREQLKLLNTSDNACRCINDDQGQGHPTPVVKMNNFIKLETTLKHRNAILQEAFKNEKTAIKDHIQKFDQRIESELNNNNQRVDAAVEYVQRINDNITVDLKSNLDKTDASVAKLTERLRDSERMLIEIKKTTRNDVDGITNQVASIKENLNALFGCLHPWTLVEELCLIKISQRDLPFHVAHKKCNGLGGKLAEPTTWAQVQALKKEAGSGRFLIGVVRNGNDWVRSSDLERQSPELAWREGEPNNRGGYENCIEVFSLGYNDISCNGSSYRNNIRAICEKRFVNL